MEGQPTDVRPDTVHRETDPSEPAGSIAPADGCFVSMRFR
jgi:hypothetical protein